MPRCRLTPHGGSLKTTVKALFPINAFQHIPIIVIITRLKNFVNRLGQIFMQRCIKPYPVQYYVIHTGNWR